MIRQTVAQTRTAKSGGRAGSGKGRGFGAPADPARAAAPDAGRGHDFARVAVSSPHAARGGRPLPPRLRVGVEALSGVSLHDVTVRYGSPLPARLGAAAHAQGTEIHVGPGQERYLAHEAWHAAQQKQGRVRATHYLGGVRVNDDPGLEREAEVMGARASAAPVAPAPAVAPPATVSGAPAAGPAVAQLGKSYNAKPPAMKAKGQKTKAAVKPDNPFVKLKPDNAFVKLMDRHAGHMGKKVNRQKRQDAALRTLATTGSMKDRKMFAAMVMGQGQQVSANRRAITSNVRMGGLNELLRTADTPDAAARSMGVVNGVEPGHAKVTNGSADWMDYQRDTSGPTANFIFRNTSASESGKGAIQDSHVNGLMKEGNTLTVGGTSWPYHNATDKRSLHSNFTRSTRVRSLAKRNFKLHKDLLVTHPDQMLSTPAGKRAPQTFRTKKGETLNLDDPVHLRRAARIAAIRGRKELSRQKRFINAVQPDPNESESEIDDPGYDVASDVDSEDEADNTWA